MAEIKYQVNQVKDQVGQGQGQELDNSNLEIEEETVEDILEDDGLENILWDMFVEHIKNKKGQSNNWII